MQDAAQLRAGRAEAAREAQRGVKTGAGRINAGEGSAQTQFGCTQIRPTTQQGCRHAGIQRRQRQHRQGGGVGQAGAWRAIKQQRQRGSGFERQLQQSALAGLLTGQRLLRLGHFQARHGARAVLRLHQIKGGLRIGNALGIGRQTLVQEPDLPVQRRRGADQGQCGALPVLFSRPRLPARHIAQAAKPVPQINFVSCAQRNAVAACCHRAGFQRLAGAGTEAAAKPRLQIVVSQTGQQLRATDANRGRR